MSLQQSPPVQHPHEQPSAQQHLPSLQHLQFGPHSHEPLQHGQEQESPHGQPARLVVDPPAANPSMVAAAIGIAISMNFFMEQTFLL